MGLPGVIAHGMLSAALLVERAIGFMEDAGKGPGAVLQSFNSRFKAMTLLGDVIAIGGTVKARAGCEVTLELHARNQREEITTVGVATFVLR